MLQCGIARFLALGFQQLEVSGFAARLWGLWGRGFGVSGLGFRVWSFRVYLEVQGTYLEPQ